MTHRSSVSKCRGCGADIAWVKTVKGANMCIEASTYEGEVMYDPQKHVNHWGKCPKAKDFKRKSAKT